MKKKLSIAIILPTIISKNGTAKQSLELAKRLTQKGHNVTFYTYAYLSSSTFPEFKVFTIKRCIDIEDGIIYKFIRNVGRLESLYLYLAFLNISRFRELINADTLNILNPHDWFGIWVCAPIKKGAKLIANINDVPERSIKSILNRKKLYFDNMYAKYVDRIIVLDTINKKKVSDWINISPTKIHVVRSGIDLIKYKNFNRPYDLRTMYSIPHKSFIIVCANLLAQNRRFEDVIHALSLVDLDKYPFHMFILSKLDYNPAYASYLISLVSSKKMEGRVHFIDKFFTDEERMAFISGGDILIFPNYPQTWGLTVIESMALGTPVIVSTGSGVSEVLINNETALIYEKKNTKELLNKILFSYKNRNKMKEISINGKKFVYKTFSWEKFAAQVEEVMHAV